MENNGREDVAQVFYHGTESLLPVRPLPGMDAPLQLWNKVIFFCVDRGLHHSGKEDRSWIFSDNSSHTQSVTVFSYMITENDFTHPEIQQTPEFLPLPHYTSRTRV